MPKTITVNVTAENIADGEPGKSYSCPINLALRPLFPSWGTPTGILVFDQEIAFRKEDGDGRLLETKYAVLPNKAENFVAAFDGSPDAPEPFSFDLELPEGLEP